MHHHYYTHYTPLLQGGQHHHYYNWMLYCTRSQMNPEQSQGVAVASADRFNLSRIISDLSSAGFNPKNEAAGRTIHIGKLDSALPEEMLKEHFEKHAGPVTKVALGGDGHKFAYRFGFVEFANAEDAQKAVANLNKTVLGAYKISIRMSMTAINRPGHTTIPGCWYGLGKQTLSNSSQGDQAESPTKKRKTAVGEDIEEGEGKTAVGEDIEEGEGFAKRARTAMFDEQADPLIQAGCGVRRHKALSEFLDAEELATSGHQAHDWIQYQASEHQQQHQHQHQQPHFMQQPHPQSQMQTPPWQANHQFYHQCQHVIQPEIPQGGKGWDEYGKGGKGKGWDVYGKGGKGKGWEYGKGGKGKGWEYGKGGKGKGWDEQGKGGKGKGWDEHGKGGTGKGWDEHSKGGKGKGRNKHGKGGKSELCKVFVKNLPAHIEWTHLKDLFEGLKPVHSSVSTDRDGNSRGFGEVMFASIKEAKQAAEYMNGYDEWSDEQPLNCYIDAKVVNRLR
jgi:RNA recognition motif-containing protein